MFTASKPTILVNMLLEPANEVSGIARYTFFLLEALLRRDRLRLVLASSWERDKLPPALAESALETRTLPYIASQACNILAQSVRVPRLLQETGADVEFEPSAVGRWSPLGGRPRILTVHDLYHRTHAENYARRHRLWWNLFFPAVSTTAASIICVSSNTHADLVSHYPKLAAKSRVVHSASGLTNDGPPLPAGDRKPYALFVANVNPNKGVATLVAAADLLARRGAGFEILHVGGDARGILATARLPFGSDLPLRSVGRVTDAQLKTLYAEASLLLFPSAYEGFGLPIVEAQSFGTPAICSDIPVLRAVAGKGALYFDVGNAQALADTVTSVMADIHLRQSLSRAAIANAARFSWDATARAYEAAVDEALSARARPCPQLRDISSTDKA
jgi:glycosyltransferase involved in cell wall biosynthesis